MFSKYRILHMHFFFCKFKLTQLENQNYLLPVFPKNTIHET